MVTEGAKSNGNPQVAAAESAQPGTTATAKAAAKAGSPTRRVHFVGSGSSDSMTTGNGIPKRAQAAEGGRGFGSTDLSTDETSDVHSYAGTSSEGGDYEVIEYDPDEPLPGNQEDIFADIETPTIEENTPAGEALRANANIHVSGVGKAARAINVQVVRKLVKRATGAGRSGVVKGKPPRVPPHLEMQEDDEQSEEGFEAVVDETKQPPLQPITEDTSEKDHDIPDHVVAGTMEAGKKVLGHVDPHDMIKLLRWRRKKKSSKKPVMKSYVKGKVIDGEHELYTLSIAVMIGVRTSISKTNTILNAGPGKRWVKPEDFRAQEKYEFRPKGGRKTPPHQLAHTFKFKDYAPVAFAYLRRMYGVNEFDFLLSVCGNANFIEFISNAKSGQFFFYSSDGKYMIKTMTNAESKFLRRILPQYFRHCAENPNTMITRFFGMYRVKMYHLRRNVKFVIMNSVYYTDKFLQTFYDLKGSSVGRDAKPGDAVKKDNDLRRGLPDEALALQPNVRQNVRAQVEADCNFLRKRDIMDYSMLVGVHHIPADRDGSIASSGFRGGRPRAHSAASRSGEGVDGLDRDTMMSPPSANAVAPGVCSSAQAPSSNSREAPAAKLAAIKKHTSERRHNKSDSLGGFFFDNGLEDDDSSYLMGSVNRPAVENSPSFSEETEQKKQATIENLFWPFHKLFDIHGYRRVEPVRCVKCSNKPCTCPDDPILKGYKIPRFVPPLSDRKDGGFEVDTTGQQLPLKIKGSQGEQLYDGKIVYMGIIDILQEYTSRKLLETKYRMVQSKGKPVASCVHPRVYSNRFLSFFDTYTERSPIQPAKNKTASADVGIEMDASGEVVDESEAT